jgi:hypothetical protein
MTLINSKAMEIQASKLNPVAAYSRKVIPI